MYNKIKRILDLISGVIALPILGIICVIVAPLIYMEDKGKIFYCADRIGKDGRLFKMYKFRSMKENAPDIRLEDGSTFNGKNDPRVTKIGRILRETSIDELPQIINVVRGDMSWIGPRPDPPDWLERYPEDVKGFLKVRPGITGYSQAYFRNGVNGVEKMKNDLYYAEHCTFGMDIKVFFKTICTVLKREGTYK